MLHDLTNFAALLHSNGQLRTERYGDTEKDVKNLWYSRRLLMMMMTTTKCGLITHVGCSVSTVAQPWPYPKVCLFAWCLTALSAHIGYIVQQACEIYIV